jgi:hypothetical protein
VARYSRGVLGREPINLQGVRLARVRYAPIATKFRSAAKCRDGPCDGSKLARRIFTSQAWSVHHFAIVINAVDLKYRLGNVETDCRDRLHDLAPPNRGGFNSTHIHGTHVPAEEPSTAS